MTIENLTNPGVEPVDGDMIRITHPNGSTEERQYWTYVAPAPEPSGTVVPRSITMRQARLALLAVGKLDHVATAINALPSPLKEKAQIEWEYSNEVQRHNGLVAQLGPALGLTEEVVDTLFIAGATL